MNIQSASTALILFQVQIAYLGRASDEMQGAHSKNNTVSFDFGNVGGIITVTMKIALNFLIDGFTWHTDVQVYNNHKLIETKICHESWY